MFLTKDKMGEKEYTDLEAGSISKLIVDEDDAAWALAVNRKITYFGLTPLAVIGIVLNIIVIFTWRKYSSSFHVAIFLFEALAVTDIVYMGCFFLWYYSTQASVQQLIWAWLAFSTRSLLVNINFLMTVVRWIAIKYPFKFRSRFSAFRVRLVLGIIILYCGVIHFLVLLVKHINVPKYAQVITEVTLDQISLSFPLLVQFVLSIGIVWLTWSIKRKVQSGWVHGTVRQPSLNMSRMSAKLAFGRNRRLTAIIVSISLMTFLAYPVGITLIAYFKLAKAPPKASFKRIVFACINLFHVFNSSVSFFIYVAFMPEFRRNLRQLLCPWREGVSPERHPKPSLRTVSTAAENKNVPPRISEIQSLAETFATPTDLVEEFYK